MTQFYWLALGSLCAWRITHLLQAEDGPWNLIAHLRRRAAESVAGHMMDCFYCLSIWVAAPFALALGATPLEQLLLWPAISAGAIGVQRIIDGDGKTLPASYLEDEEN
jgi:hypothetical protein